MGADYIPERDINAACWMKTFARALVQNPSGYRTTPENAAEIEDAVLAFRVAYVSCRSPITRTSPMVRGKNSARAAAEKLVRHEAQRIRIDTRIEAALKLNIGLNPERQRRRQVGTPGSVPGLIITPDPNGSMKILVLDSVSDKRGRPRDASGLELYDRVRSRAEVESVGGASQTETVLSDDAGVPIGWRFVGVYTRSEFAVQPSTRNPGDEVSYVARWINRRGEPGAFGLLVIQRIRFNIAPFNTPQPSRRRRAA